MSEIASGSGVQFVQYFHEQLQVVHLEQEFTVHALGSTDAFVPFVKGMVMVGPTVASGTSPDRAGVASSRQITMIVLQMHILI